MKTEHWAYIGIVLSIILLLGKCSSGGGIDTDALEIRLIGKYHMSNPHISSYKKVSSDPPTYEFEVDYENRNLRGLKVHATGRVTLYEDGDFDNIWLID